MATDNPFQRITTAPADSADAEDSIYRDLSKKIFEDVDKAIGRVVGLADDDGPLQLSLCCNAAMAAMTHLAWQLRYVPAVRGDTPKATKANCMMLAALVLARIETDNLPPATAFLTALKDYKLLTRQRNKKPR